MERRVIIVFQETDAEGGKGFDVFIEGLDPAANDMNHDEQLQRLSRVDFWALRCFQIIGGILRQTGALHTVRPK